MSRFPRPFATPGTLESSYAASSSSIAAFMNAVYAWMCVGLGVTAVVGWYVSTNTALMQTIFSGPGMIVLFISILALPWIIQGAIHKLTATTATALFLLYAALLGAALSYVFIVYTGASVAATFGVTAGTFASMSLVGFVTKKDLTNLGGFLMMAVIGLIIASIVNVFVASSALYWIVTYAGVLIFMGLTAYHTQMLKGMAASVEGDRDLAGRLAIVGALVLYIDFINMFMYLLRILGKGRD